MAEQQRSELPPQQPPGCKRLAVILSALAYVLLLGVPVWWRSTSLHRPPLPHGAIAAVADAAARPALLPLSLQLVLAVPPGAQLPDGLSEAALLRALRGAVELSVAVSVARQCGPAAAESCSGSDGDGGGACQLRRACPDLSGAPVPGGSGDVAGLRRLDEWLAQRAEPQAPGRYALFLLPQQQQEQQQQESQQQAAAGGVVVVGRHRHAWLSYDPAAAAAAPDRLLAAAGAAAARVLGCCFGLHASAAALAAAGALPVSPGGGALLSFSLLNAEPGAGPHFTWDFASFERDHLAPLAAALAPAVRLDAESQVLGYTPARTPGAWSAKHRAWVVRRSQLPFFVDSEWAVESGRAVLHPGGGGSPLAGGGGGGGDGGAAAADQLAAPPHVLHFVVYVPPADRAPLLLLGPRGAPRDSNSFWTPGWGGVLVLNPPAQQARGEDEPGGGAAPAARAPGQAVPLGDGELAHVAAVVAAQLQALLGVAPPDDGDDGDGSDDGGGGGGVPLRLPAGRAGFAAWQVDALLRQRAGADVAEAARVLGSLSRLVQELPNLEMPDLIGQQVSAALEHVAAARAAVAGGRYAAAGAAARAARRAAEAAFSHPAVLAQLNFPESHKLGVYMPLFLPAAVPLLQGVAGQAARYVTRRRRWAAAGA
ncbi:hypothetical protein HT031_006625 [Scenedesmus sp. PABB004]|nr:hypothetical protein HT031_006625 [Scenedesmus sp. PABB004]